MHKRQSVPKLRETQSPHFHTMDFVKNAGGKKYSFGHQRRFTDIKILHLQRDNYRLNFKQTHFFFFFTNKLILIICITSKTVLGAAAADFASAPGRLWLAANVGSIEEAQISSLCCHSPVQCCLNIIRQGSTVKRLKA